MKLEVLVSTVNADVKQLIKRMRIKSDAIIINQCEKNGYEELYDGNHLIRVFSFNERGIGLSRNNALMRAKADIVLFADDDEVLNKNYEKMIVNEFLNNKKADMLFFNVKPLNCERNVSIIKKYGRVRRYNCLRYGAVRIAVLTSKVRKKNILFSLLFGGGAKFGSGEDSIFIYDCIKKGLKLFSIPLEIASVDFSNSSWFNGYTEKYYFDKGALLYSIYGKKAPLFIIMYLLKHKSEKSELSFKQKYASFISGYRFMKKN